MMIAFMLGVLSVTIAITGWNLCQTLRQLDHTLLEMHLLAKSREIRERGKWPTT